MEHGPLVAIGTRFRRLSAFITLGPRPNLSDYSPQELELILRAERIFYPTPLLAPQLAAMGKRIFPSLACHILEGDKPAQARLIELLGLPQPRSRVFFGPQRKDVLRYFSLPLIAKTPRGSAMGRGVWLVETYKQLEEYLKNHNPAYIQEYVQFEMEVRVIVVGAEPVCAYCKRPAPGEFRANLSRGADILLLPPPPQALEVAVALARGGGLSETAVDIGISPDGPMILEFSYMYGRRGPARLGLDIVAEVAKRVLTGRA